ncbi:hypothetical protein HPHPH9_1424 [Helicobacter pylori Hp H-9]|nr:hypothetical protein HPHPH9_1424 [Helicobacter pylori Hp H-9]
MRLVLTHFRFENPFFAPCNLKILKIRYNHPFNVFYLFSMALFLLVVV